MGFHTHSVSPVERAALLAAERDGQALPAYRDGLGDLRLLPIEDMERVTIGRATDNWAARADGLSRRRGFAMIAMASVFAAAPATAGAAISSPTESNTVSMAVVMAHRGPQEEGRQVSRLTHALHDRRIPKERRYEGQRAQAAAAVGHHPVSTGAF